MNKIRNIEITPAQLALDPCTASCVVTNVRTGEVMALVTYPSYDNNRISDPEYFAQLNADQSLPLRNNATQTLKAPGSPLSLSRPLPDWRKGQSGLMKPSTVPVNTRRPIRRSNAGNIRASTAL